MISVKYRALFRKIYDLRSPAVVRFSPPTWSKIAEETNRDPQLAEGARSCFGESHPHAKLKRSAEESGGEVEGGRTGGECARGDVEPGGGQRGRAAVGENARAVSGGATIIVQAQQDRQRLRMHETFHTALADWFIPGGR